MDLGYCTWASFECHGLTFLSFHGPQSPLKKYKNPNPKIRLHWEESWQGAHCSSSTERGPLFLFPWRVAESKWIFDWIILQFTPFYTFEWNVRTLSSPTKWHQTQNSWRWIGESLLSYPSRLLISYTKKIIWHMWTRALIYRQEVSGLIWWLLEIGKLDRREVCGEFSWCLLWFFSLVSAVMGYGGTWVFLLSVNIDMNWCEVLAKWIRQFWELMFGLLQHLLKGIMALPRAWSSLMLCSSPSTCVFVWCHYRELLRDCTCGFTWSSDPFCENMMPDPTRSMC